MIPVHRPFLSRVDVQAVTRVLTTRQIGGNGPVGRDVERLLARQLDAPHVLLMTSCTHACQAALRALKIGPGDEVIVPSYSYVSMANAVLNVGARPVFVDVEPAHLTMDPAAAAAAITPRTKALLAVHYAGYPCDMDALTAVAKRHNLALIEDAAQAIGSALRGRALGTIGDVGCLSFHETKNITCGEGGAFVTSHPVLAHRADLLREKGTNRSEFLQGKVPRYEWMTEGDNYVLSELQAALLRSQLSKLDAILTVRRRLGLRYLDRLRPLEARGVIRLPRFESAHPPVTYNWHLFYIMVQPPWRRDAIMAFLRQRRIQSTFHFIALHTTPMGQRLHTAGPLPRAEAADRQLLRLPLYAGLRLNDQDRVIESLAAAFAGRAA